MKVNVKIEDYELLNMLEERVKYWTDDKVEQELFNKMYENYVEGGCFDGIDFDVMQIVDNDYVNWCQAVYEGEDNFNDILEVYKRQGIGDCSCEGLQGINWIEAVNDEEEPTVFLIRY